MHYREANISDSETVAKLLAKPETQDFWISRVQGYFKKEHHPQKALLPRVVYVAIENEVVGGLIAGHLTERFGCQGELQWISVAPKFRNAGVASSLLIKLAEWFVSHNAFYICVDVGSEVGRNFYLKHGAENLNEHWMIWKDIRMLVGNTDTTGKKHGA